MIRAMLSFLHAELLVNVMVLVGLVGRNTADPLSQRHGGVIKLVAVTMIGRKDAFVG